MSLDEMAPKPQLSGIQKQVLGLYREFLRAARLKAPEERRKIEEIVSTEFKRNSKDIDRKNFLYIEHLIRRGKRQLDQLNSPGTVGLSTLKVSPSAAANKSSQADSQSDPLYNDNQQGDRCEAAARASF
uniref:Succinate dehydrogenase assembly factor 1, mitochondrial n=1 Tax=Anthurium amnicola TaxID=1678845 RepID=A0A1D1XU85_9ARAE